MFWKNKKEKIKPDVYNKDKKAIKVNYRLVFYAVILVLFLIVLVGGTVFYFNDKREQTKKAEEAARVCNDLLANDNKTEGLAPFRPVVKAKLLGAYDAEKAICDWKFNGVDAGSTKPFEGNCIRDGLAYHVVGSTTVGLSIKGTDCDTSIKLTVTGLSEEQEAENLALKQTKLPNDHQISEPGE